jgi:diguanylate cyclase (GGDEF)-like protein
MNWITPYRLRADERHHSRTLHTALVRELYVRGRVPTLILAGSVLVLYGVFMGEATHSRALRGLFLALVAMMLFRVTLVLQGDRLQGRNRRLVPRFLLYLAGSLGLGLVLGAMSLLAFHGLEPGHFLLVCLYSVGICSVAAVSVAGSPLCFAAIALPVMGSLMVGGCLHPPFGLGWRFPVTALFGTGALTYIAMYVHYSLCRNILLAERLGDLALRDPLTGLRNRRFLQEFMQEEAPRALRRWLVPESAHRSQRSMSIIMLDLDLFKQVNDQYGHAAGDAVLVQVAQLLREVVRKPDLVVRWGGEEFLILALDSDRIAPPLIAVRVHERLAKHEFVLPGGQIHRQTCSIGFAIYPFHPARPDGLPWEQVFRLADESLYMAKENGRNRLNGILPGRAHPDLVIEALNLPEPDFDAARAAELIELI